MSKQQSPRSHGALKLPFPLGFYLGSLSLLFGMTLAFVGAALLITILEPVGIALKLPPGSCPDLETALILIALGGLWFTDEIYKTMSRCAARHFDLLCSVGK